MKGQIATTLAQNLRDLCEELKTLRRAGRCFSCLLVQRPHPANSPLWIGRPLLPGEPRDDPFRKCAAIFLNVGIYNQSAYRRLRIFCGRLDLPHRGTLSGANWDARHREAWQTAEAVMVKLGTLLSTRDLPDNLWHLIPPDTSRQTHPLLRWVYAVFDLAWAELPWSPLRATQPRTQWFVRHEDLPMPFPTQFRDGEHWWYSTLSDLLDSSIEAAKTLEAPLREPSLAERNNWPGTVAYCIEKDVPLTPEGVANGDSKSAIVNQTPANVGARAETQDAGTESSASVGGTSSFSPHVPLGFLGGKALADALGVQPTRRTAFFQELMRQRMTLGDDCWHEVHDRRANACQYFYRVDSPAVQDLAARYMAPKKAPKRA